MVCWKVSILDGKINGIGDVIIVLLDRFHDAADHVRTRAKHITSLGFCLPPSNCTQRMTYSLTHPSSCPRAPVKRRETISRSVGLEYWPSPQLHISMICCAPVIPYCILKRSGVGFNSPFRIPFPSDRTLWLGRTRSLSKLDLSL